MRTASTTAIRLQLSKDFPSECPQGAIFVMWDGVFRLVCPILLNLSLLTIISQYFPQPRPSTGFTLWSPLIGFERSKCIFSFVSEGKLMFICLSSHKPSCMCWPTSRKANRERRAVLLGLCTYKLSENQAFGEREEEPIWCPLISWWLSVCLRTPDPCGKGKSWNMVKAEPYGAPADRRVSNAKCLCCFWSGTWPPLHKSTLHYRVCSVSRQFAVKQYSPGGVSALGLS